MLETLENLPMWAIKALALALGLLGAAAGGLVLSRMLTKVREKLPPPED